MEGMLNTLFPDRTVRDFMLDVGASLLRKRNRYKHFYVLTGNTNGGKSLFMSLLKHAFGPLFGVLPLLGRGGGPTPTPLAPRRTHSRDANPTHPPIRTTWLAPRGCACAW